MQRKPSSRIDNLLKKNRSLFFTNKLYFTTRIQNTKGVERKGGGIADVGFRQKSMRTLGVSGKGSCSQNDSVHMRLAVDSCLQNPILNHFLQFQPKFPKGTSLVLQERRTMSPCK